MRQGYLIFDPFHVGKVNTCTCCSFTNSCDKLGEFLLTSEKIFKSFRRKVHEHVDPPLKEILIPVSSF